VPGDPETLPVASRPPSEHPADGISRRVQAVLTTALLLANLVGAVVVVVLATFVIPGPTVFSGSAAPVTFVVLPLYILAALAGGTLVGTKEALAVLDWVKLERTPTTAEAEAAFAVPARLVVVQAALWAVAVALFTTLYGLSSTQNLPRVAFPISFGGIVVCANAFLLSEYALRPVSARALRVHTPDRKAGVRARTLLAWGLGSGVPVLGLMTVALFSLVRRDLTVTRLAVTVLALGLSTLVFGFGLMVLLSQATVRPIRAVRAALSAIAGGDLSAEVEVDDGTELGELQAGFNLMVDGLRERDRVRDLFGRHVGESVATAALESRPRLGGEERYVAVLFVDLVGSTAMAATRPAAEVVDLLNRFFAVVVEEVEGHGGLVNKFIGDAVMAIFGAPTPLPDPSGHALGAARRLMERMAAEVPECELGAAVAAGVAVAGNVGARERFEYTVIGDPVNEAARLGELAKTEGGLLASGAAVAAAADGEGRRWAHGRDVQLRGRTETTAVFHPATAEPEVYSGDRGAPCR
jgi:adenylate cyclase